MESRCLISAECRSEVDIMNELYRDACTIVVHMQNHFNDKNQYSIERIRAAKKVVETSRLEKIPVIYIKCILPTIEYGRDIINALKPEKSDIVLLGLEEDGFQGYGLRSELKKKNIKKLVMIGCNAGACYGKTFKTASNDPANSKTPVFLGISF